MKNNLYHALLAAAPLVSAQTYSGFTLDISTELDIIYGDTNITNGEQLPRAEVLSPPEIGSPGTRSETGRSCLIMMDSDVPTNTTSRTTLLHWLAPDITGVTSGQNGSLLTLPPNGTGVPYLPPSPPVGDYPHRYSFLLFEQPRNFSIPPNINETIQSRRGFDLEGFLSSSGLAQGAALAANYMLVANVSGPATTQFPPPLYTASSTLASSEANATPTSTPESSSGSAGAGTTASASGSGAAATESASSTAEGATLRAGSGVALLAAIFGMLLM